MLDREQDGGASGKRLQTAGSSQIQPKPALPVTSLHGAKASTTRTPPPNLLPTTPCRTQTARQPLKSQTHRRTGGVAPSDRAKSPVEPLRNPRVGAEGRLSSPSPRPAKPDTRSCRHRLANESSDQQLSATTLAAAASPLPRPASDSCLQWVPSLSSLTKAETLPQASDPIPYPITYPIHSPRANCLGSTLRRRVMARSHSSSSLEPLGGTWESGSKSGHEKTKSQKMTLFKSESCHRRQALEAEDSLSQRERPSSRLDRPPNQPLHPVKTSLSQRHHPSLRQSESERPDSDLLVDCTMRVARTCRAFVAKPAKRPSLAARAKTPYIPEGATGAMLDCQSLLHPRPTGHFQTDGGSLTSHIRSKGKNGSPHSDSQWATGGPFTKRNNGLSTSDGMGLPEGQRRASAPAHLSFHLEPKVSGLQTAQICGELTHKTTSTCQPDMSCRVEQIKGQFGTPPCPSMTGVTRSSQTDPPIRTPPCQHHPMSEGGTKKDTTELLSGRYGPEEGTDLLTLFADHSNAGAYVGSEDDSSSDTESDDDEGDETPLTSPCTSPTKSPNKWQHFTPYKDHMVQLDGPSDTLGAFEASPGDHNKCSEGSNGTYDTVIRNHDRLRIDNTMLSGIDTASQRRYFSCIEHLSDASSDHGAYETALEPERLEVDLDDDTLLVRPEHEAYETALELERLEVELDEATPLVSPSPAKGAMDFPFPTKLHRSLSERFLSRVRHPSTLLRHCEGLATPRQRQLIRGGARTPDRFVTLRAATPTKESLLLSKAAPKLTASRRGHGRRSPPVDPFGATPRRSLRMAEQFVTVRSYPPATRPHGLRTSLVLNAESTSRRSASAGAVWSVGGTTTTEGVASVTNSRGGRVTSGTSAPHYAADFLRRNTPSEEEVTHGRRLAFAMDINQNARMLDHSLPSSPRSGSLVSGSSKQGRAWRDGRWQNTSSPLPPTKARPRKTKDIPVIPFRVLNAPALRDDYYCSLLTYSHTLNCLAVGLGPHVYLWTEKKGNGSNIPDSLTAPVGSAHVTSLSFSSVGGGSAILAIGRADGRIMLWSPLDSEPRFDSEQPSPVSCVCFRPNAVQRWSIRDPVATAATEELLVGDEVGFVYYYSVEWPDKVQRDLFNWHGSMTLLARVTCHSQQICGLAWSPDGDFFATGGNDNQMFLFETKKALKRTIAASAQPSVRVRGPSSGSSAATVAGQREVISVTPGHEKHTFSLNAAVKAIAFAPWQPTLLAAGGGSNDRCIHFFHTLSGASLATIDCHAQVTSLVWSARRKELAATFGFAQPEHPHRVAVFAWPSCDMVVKIPWYTEERALYAVAYPRGPSSGVAANAQARAAADAEGRPWYGKRTKEEGCLVVATSDASIKFHEIWAERREGGGKRVASGPLGGSQILEGECSEEVERRCVIR